MLSILLHKADNLSRRQKILETLSLVSFLAFCLIILDSAVSGSGRWLMIGPLSLRMVFGIIAAVCAIPSMLKGIKSWFKDPMLVSLIIFVVYVAICAYIGYAKGNDASLLMSDIKGYSWIFLVPVAISVVDSRERLVFLMKCVIAGAIIQAVLITGINLQQIFVPKTVELYDDIFVGTQLGGIGYITSDLIRIFFRSAPYMIAGSVCMIYFQLQGKKLNWFYPVATGLCLSAIVLTFTRSLYGAAFVTFVGVFVIILVLLLIKWKRILIHLVLSLIAALIFIFAQQALSGADYIQMAVARTFSLDIEIVENSADKFADDGDVSKKDTAKKDDKKKTNEKDAMILEQKKNYMERTRYSDNIVREKTLQELNAMIKQSPIIGNGLGASINYREDGLVEYYYQDTINKMGIIGLILYIFPFGYMAYLLIRYRKCRDKQLLLMAIICISGLLTFMVASYFNPYMNAALGIGYYSIALAGFRLFRSEASVMEIEGNIQVDDSKALEEQRSADNP